VDLRIVDTRTLMIVKTVSLTKHFNGFEVGFNIFRFFDSKLYDINIGAQGQEPVQLGVRAALEEGVIKLISAVTNVNSNACMTMRPGAGEHFPTTPAEQLRKVANPEAPNAVTPVQNGVAVNTEAQTGTSMSGTATQVPFEFGSSALGGGTMVLLDRIAAAAKQGQVDVVLVARDTENWDATKRDGLINQRIAAVTSALANRGIAAAAISVTWRPDPADNAIHRDGPGLQEIAKLRIGSAVAAAPPVIDPVRR
jgi:outer membrane protein OmpA-like peptidoglycan-associated protein